MESWRSNFFSAFSERLVSFDWNRISETKKPTKDFVETMNQLLS